MIPDEPQVFRVGIRQQAEEVAVADLVVAVQKSGNALVQARQQKAEVHAGHGGQEGRVWRQLHEREPSPKCEVEDPNRAGEPPCNLVEGLVAANVAWAKRQNLVDNGLVYALLSHNSANEHQFLQPMAAQFNTALNVLIDKWPLPKPPKIPQPIRESLAKAVEAVVATHPDLSDDARKGYTPLLRSRVMDGPYSMLDRLIQLLQDLGVVQSSADTTVFTRVRYLNTVRNRLTYSGEMPLLKDMTQEQSDGYTVQIVGGVLQSINQMAIGKMLGFTANGVGAQSQDTTALRRFFVEGIWNNYPIETRSFSDWIEDPLGLG